MKNAQSLHKHTHTQNLLNAWAPPQFLSFFDRTQMLPQSGCLTLICPICPRTSSKTTPTPSTQAIFIAACSIPSHCKSFTRPGRACDDKIVPVACRPPSPSWGRFCRTATAPARTWRSCQSSVRGFGYIKRVEDVEVSYSQGASKQDIKAPLWFLWLPCSGVICSNCLSKLGAQSGWGAKWFRNGFTIKGSINVGWIIFTYP